MKEKRELIPWSKITLEDGDVYRSFELLHGGFNLGCSITFINDDVNFCRSINPKERAAVYRLAKLKWHNKFKNEVTVN